MAEAPRNYPICTAARGICLRLALIVIALWQRLLSPLFGQHCRYHPTCSQYAAEALRRHGVLRGLLLALRRLLRCNALFTGGVDEVPGLKRELDAH